MGAPRAVLFPLQWKAVDNLLATAGRSGIRRT